MKTYGLKEKQELISIPLDDDNNPRLDTLKPSNAGDDWMSPEVIPLVKLPQPTLNPLIEYCEPKLVWFSDRVERDWEIKTIPPIPPEQIAARNALPDAKSYQLKVWLIRNNIPLETVPDIIRANYPPGPERDEALIRWEYVESVPANHPLVAIVAAGLTPPVVVADVWPEILAI